MTRIEENGMIVEVSCPFCVYYIREETQQRRSVITTEYLDVSGVSGIPTRSRKRCILTRAYRCAEKDLTQRNGYIHSTILKRCYETSGIPYNCFFAAPKAPPDVVRRSEAVYFLKTWRSVYWTKDILLNGLLFYSGEMCIYLCQIKFIPDALPFTKHLYCKHIKYNLTVMCIERALSILNKTGYV